MVNPAGPIENHRSPSSKTTLRSAMALVEMLESADDLAVTSTFSSGEEAIEEIGHAVPDVVLMDIRLPGMSGIDCVRRLKGMGLPIHIMMFTSFEDDEGVFESLAAGANGYLLKRSKAAAVIEAIRELHNGGSPMSPAIARKLVKHFQKAAVAPVGRKDDYELSDREQQVLQMLADGLRYKEIADRLGLSVATVRTYLGRVYDKLHVSSRTEAVVKFLKADR